MKKEAYDRRNREAGHRWDSGGYDWLDDLYAVALFAVVITIVVYVGDSWVQSQLAN